jgi:general secretion pathway protein J
MMPIKDQRLSLQSAGFTLPELLVALLIYAMLSAGGVMLLRASVDTQSRLAEQFSDTGDQSRLDAMLERELRFAVARAVRKTDGSSDPALVGTAQSLRFTAQGGMPSVGVLPSFTRISYQFANGQWTRAAAQRPDGAELSKPIILRDDIAKVDIRYRAPDGKWQSDWGTSTSGPIEQSQDILPIAVEIKLTAKNGLETLWVMPIGAAQLAPVGGPVPAGPAAP